MGTAFHSSLQNRQHVCWGYITHRQLADAWKNDTTQHIQAPVFGHIFPVFRL
jgi:hypothetical protein